jgi:hypothetical protein
VEARRGGDVLATIALIFHQSSQIKSITISTISCF